MSAVHRLTPARLRTAMAVLAAYPFGSYDIVLARLTEIFGFDVTGLDLGTAFQRAGLSSPENYMVDAPLKHCPSCRCKVRR